MAARILRESPSPCPTVTDDADYKHRLAALGRAVLDRIHTTPISTLHGRTAGALLVDLLRDARACDLLDDNFGGVLR